MTTREEIQIRLGMDSKALQSGMSSLKSKISHWSKEIGAQFLAAFAFHAILEQLKSAIENVKQLTQRAGALEISNSFLQDLENVGIAAGKTQQQIEKMITAFARTLGPGADVEQEFLKFLDVLKKTESPTDRLRLAFEKLGKSGVILLDFAKDGSAAFKEAASEFAKLSDEQIRRVMEVSKTLDAFQNQWKTFLGSLVAGFVLLSDKGDALLALLKSMFDPSAGYGGGSSFWSHTEEEVGILRKTEELNRRMISHAEKIAAAKAAAALSDKRMLDLQIAIGKQIEANNSKIRGLAGERAAGLRGLSDVPMTDAQKAADAKFGPMGGQLKFSDKQLGDVRFAEQLDFNSKQQRIFGDTKEADKLQEMRRKVLKRLGFLSPDEMDPLRGINEKLEAANKEAFAYYALAKENGIAVKLVAIP